VDPEVSLDVEVESEHLQGIPGPPGDLFEQSAFDRGAVDHWVAGSLPRNRVGDRSIGWPVAVALGTMRGFRRRRVSAVLLRRGGVRTRLVRFLPGGSVL